VREDRDSIPSSAERRSQSNMNIRVIIVDDEPLARKRIRRFLADEPEISIVAECGMGREAIQTIESSSPDVLFLDIQMPEMGGFEVLQSISPERMPFVIFTTAYDEHALKAFEVHALDYLLKPFNQARFQKALERARMRLANRGPGENKGLTDLIGKLRTEQTYLSRFMIKSASRVVLLKANEVDWIESAANYALLHVGDKTHLVRETMQTLETRLCPRTFQRISRSAIVNLERVRELQPLGKGQYVIILTSGKQLMMTRGIRDLQASLELR
jgi:two-component system LytT family response regulator